jgi:hypothetical protein
MPNPSLQLKHFLLKRSTPLIGLFIFLGCLFVYLANGRSIVVNDTFPNSLLALSWIRNNTLNFDAFREVYITEELPWFFVEAPNGHLTSTYPIGTAIVTFPLYLLLALYLKLLNFLQTGIFDFSASLPAITDPDFHKYRHGFQKLVAAIATALSVALFYLSLRLKFDNFTSLITTFIFAFATTTWVISSQGLWQHTASNLVLTGLILCLLKINRTEGTPKTSLLLVAGFFCGLLPGIRPTSALFSLAAIAYVASVYRKEMIFLSLGLPAAGLQLGWNFYYFGFGNLIGGYSKQFSTGHSSYIFTFQYFKEAFWGLLLSPSRGILIFSPILLLATVGAYQLFRRMSGKDEKLFACLTVACLILFIHYCFYFPWYASLTYGPRFLTDLLPVLCFLIGYLLDAQFKYQYHLPGINNACKVSSTSSPQVQGSLQKKILSITAIVFLIFLLFSTFTQIVGSFGNPLIWNGLPIKYESRLWEWRDNQISRATQGLFFKLIKPIKAPKVYLQKTDGVIQQIQDENEQSLIEPILVHPSEQRVIKAQVRNTGATQWFGYETGMGRGETRIKPIFVNQSNQQILPDEFPFPGQLHVSGMPKPGGIVTAIGTITFPKEPGNYTMILKLVIYKIGDFPSYEIEPPFQLEVKVI